MNLIAWDKEADTAILPERPPVDLEWARFPSGVKKQYNEPVAPNPEPIEIIITSITGALIVNGDNTKVTCNELTNVTISGSLAIPDQLFSLPIRRDDGRVFLFAAQVTNGAFTVVINFPATGQFTYSDNECNIDLPYEAFTVNTIKLDVLRVIV